MMERRALVDLLARHTPTDRREADHLSAMQALLETTDAPFDRAQFQPGHFTASAFVLSPDQTGILLIFHRKLERWLQPGGHFDAGDGTFLRAAMRELEEETGLGPDHVRPESQTLLDVDVHAIPANPRKSEPAHAHYDVRVLFQALTESTEAGSDALETRWVRLDHVETVETDASVMRAVRKIRKRLSSSGETMGRLR